MFVPMFFLDGVARYLFVPMAEVVMFAMIWSFILSRTLVPTGGSAGPPMFVISDTRKLRVYINVPQSFVPMIKIGAQAAISVPEYPGKSFRATLEFSSQAVDTASVTIARDLGRDIEIATGLVLEDRIIITPPDGLSDGDPVRIAKGTKDGNAPR